MKFLILLFKSRSLWFDVNGVIGFILEIFSKKFYEILLYGIILGIFNYLY